MENDKDKKDVDKIDDEENKDVEDQDNKDETGKPDDESKPDKGGDDAKSAKTFTQDQLNKMMTREKNQGRNSVYKELGINPKDSKTIAMVKAMLDSQKTDEEKKAEQETENQAKITEAEQRAQVAEAKAEAMMLGVKTQYVEDVVTLALAKMTEDSDLKTIIGEFKTKYPVWFGESDDDDDSKKKDTKSKTGLKGTGSSIKSTKEDSKKEDTKGLGARLAAQRRGNKKKSSYWGK